MNHKSFVFFDCECANTFDGVGKICSLGYVITDDEFNVIESEDVVMNPECDFDWYLFSGKGECKLAYSKDYFRVKPNFESYYKDIKKLFTTGNRYIAGFAVGNDVAFVNSACERYELPYMQFSALDLESLFSQHYGEHKKLKEWAEYFGVNLEKFQTHKSVDDAMMTMLCLKKFCKETGTPIEEVFTGHKDKFVNSEQMLIQQEERAYRREMTEKIKRLFNKKCPKPRYKNVLGQVFEFDHNVLKDVDSSFELIKKIYDNGGVTYEHATEKGSNIICFDEPKGEYAKKIEKRGLKVILVDDLYNLLK